MEYLHYTLHSKNMMEQAKKVMPGGVTANIKHFPPHPIVMKHGNGAFLTDVDGNSYIDYLLSYGVLMTGHGHPELKETIQEQIQQQGTWLFGTPHELEITFAKQIINDNPSMDRIRYTTSGTEATLLALRFASAYTNKHKIAKVEGHYHGGFDQVLVSISPPIDEAGDPKHPNAIPESKGIHPFYQKETIVLPFNDIEGCRLLLEKNKDDIGAVILEPILAGFIPAEKTFIQKLRKITEELGILLIFDEVKTGYRITDGGAHKLYGVEPDLTCFGKVIGGGLPIGLVGGKKDIMMESAPTDKSDVFDASSISKAKDVLFHSGTYNGYPLVLACGLKVLEILQRDLNRVVATTEKLREELEKLFYEKGIPMKAVGVGSIFNVVFTDKAIKNYRDWKKSDVDLRKKIDYMLLAQGIYNKPLNRYNLSVAHGNKEIERTLDSYKKVLQKL